MESQLYEGMPRRGGMQTEITFGDSISKQNLASTSVRATSYTRFGKGDAISQRMSTPSLNQPLPISYKTGARKQRPQSARLRGIRWPINKPHGVFTVNQLEQSGRERFAHTATHYLLQSASRKHSDDTIPL